ncbi:hypothetical protein J7384_17865 [Endozoicomonas sp. G2_1]|uniref:portal protein n=1 Tax=Endozoicomonas sp. G2_1 TaxID=2821091 RepID=UPI001ADCDFC3|nr:hypothetical protein [Endozoicomonas sp. G2_1]MBO9492233.1 hypothetical protein [Endozoicomonas sp. G2_1]
MFDLSGRPLIEAIIEDINQQPSWRVESARAEAYYDGRQLEPEVVSVMEERGQPVIIVNLMQPAINGVLGNEAKTRRDAIVQADDEKGTEVSEGLNEKLNEHSRLAMVDRAVSDAYGRQVKAGLGWVEVRRNTDPFGEDYVAEEVDWREIHWDWASKRPDLKDARWACRERWFDEDTAKLTFPKHKELIENVFSDWEELNTNEGIDELSPDLLGCYNEQDASNLDRHDWFSDERKQVRVVHLFKRVYEQGVVLISDNLVVKFERNNSQHMNMVLFGGARLEKRSYVVMRELWYIGMHMVHDGYSRYPHNEFPWVPFWGYREGDTRKPYGLAKAMMPAQDEYNFRRSVLTWILKARRVIMDDDATDMSNEDVRAEVAKPDGVIILNAKRRNLETQTFKIDAETHIASQQFTIMQEAKGLIQDVAGVYPSFLGQEGDGVKSGIAIASLVEQGSVTLSELNDNYRFARQKVYELLLAMIVEDIGDKPMQVVVNRNDSAPTKTIKLNEVVGDGSNINNQVALTKSHVVLADIQSTAGYRAQAQDRLVAIAQSLPEQAQLALLPDIIELSDLPRKHERVQEIKQAMGLPVSLDDVSDELRQKIEAQQKKQAELEQLSMKERQLAIAKQEAELLESQQRAGKYEADSQLAGVKAVDLMTQIQQKEQQMSFAGDDRVKQAAMEIDQLFGQMPH